MSEYAIEVKDVTKIYKLYARNRDRLMDSLGLSKKRPRYKEHFALSHLSFNIKQGECVGIIGTNGAGKSTILKIITGVLSPTFGEVNIDGRISALLELGAGFNGEYTGIENVYLNGTMIGFSKEEIDERLQEILDFADIGDFVYQPVKTYSSGMFVRLAFAIAINIEPEILIVDEALSVGDVFFQAKCFRKFEEFKSKGKTILFVSHDLSSIQTYCDRAILLNEGKKVGEDTPGVMIDLFKRILAGENVAQAKISAEKRRRLNDVNFIPGEGEASETVERWKDSFEKNPSYQEYGDQRAEILDYALVDDTGKLTQTLIKGNEFTIKFKIKAYEDIADPIAAFTIRNAKGVEITGSNTMIEKTEIGPMKSGEERVISFTQNMTLQGGEYLVCLGLTRFDRDDFHVYHRLYDVMGFGVVSVKNSVGFYDMESQVKVEKV